MLLSVRTSSLLSSAKVSGSISCFQPIPPQLTPFQYIIQQTEMINHLPNPISCWYTGGVKPREPKLPNTLLDDSRLEGSQARVRERTQEIGRRAYLCMCMCRLGRRSHASRYKYTCLRSLFRLLVACVCAACFCAGSGSLGYSLLIFVAGAFSTTRHAEPQRSYAIYLHFHFLEICKYHRYGHPRLSNSEQLNSRQQKRARTRRVTQTTTPTRKSNPPQPSKHSKTQSLSHVSFSEQTLCGTDCRTP